MLMMTKFLCVPILVLFISANLASEIQDGFVPQPDENPAEKPPKPQIPREETPFNPAELFAELFNRDPNSKPNCEEWETIKLTLKDIDISNPENIIREKAVTINTGNLKGHRILLEELYDFNMTTKSGRVCACHVEGTPCIPLCCKSYQQSSMKDGKLTCVNKNEDATVLDDFAKHLASIEKLEEHKFVIVHHSGLDTLGQCANAALSYKPGSSHRINPKNGTLKTKEEIVFEPMDYCYLSEKNGIDYKFAPVYCQKSAGFQTAPSPIAIICYSIASIAVLFLATP